jgi:hypothetical protein
MTNDERMTKSEWQRKPPQAEHLVIRHLDFFRHLDFVIGHLAAAPPCFLDGGHFQFP